MPEIPLHFFFFPGMVFHELSHLIACVLFGVRVSKVKFFGTEEAFVEHAKPNAWQSVLITIAPFILGNAVAFYLFIYANELSGAFNAFSVLFYWLGFSLAIFSFPSRQDATNAFGSFLDFYKGALFGGRPLLDKLLWLLAFPFLFVPLVLLLGTMVAFDYSILLRFLWAALFFFFSFEPLLLPGLVSWAMQFFLRLFPGVS